MTKYYPLATKHLIDFSANFFKLDVYVKPDYFFKMRLPDITPNYLTLKNRKDCLRLIRNPLQFYQNQFNMAIWFTTTGCRISINDHLNHKIPLIRSIFRFHVYYQIRKIFKTQIPLPGDPNFNEINNNINLTKYKELLSEFNFGDEYDFAVFVNNDGRIFGVNQNLTQT
jgi:hypothetical protein